MARSGFIGVGEGGDGTSVPGRVNSGKGTASRKACVSRIDQSMVLGRLRMTL